MTGMPIGNLLEERLVTGMPLWASRGGKTGDWYAPLGIQRRMISDWYATLGIQWRKIRDWYALLCIQWRKYW